MKMESAKISVIVPCYNIAEYIPRCLDSILAQTYRNIEIIAIDDGSTDTSGEVLDRYAEKYNNIKVIHQENRGVTTARLNGIRITSGEWIGFVDGDDYIEPNMYERLYTNAITYNAEISHCGYRMIFADGRVHYFYNTDLLAKQDKITGLKELLSGSKIEPGLWNKLFHKTLFHSLLHDNIMDTSIKIHEDMLMNFYLFSEAENSVFDDWCPYHYIVRNTSASRAKLNEHKIYDPIKVRKIILENAPDYIKDEAKKGYINSCLNTCNAIITTDMTAYRNEYSKIRVLLLAEKKDYGLLGRKRKYMALGAVYFPKLYGILYRIYSKYFSKKVYE